MSYIINNNFFSSLLPKYNFFSFYKTAKIKYSLVFENIYTVFHLSINISRLALRLSVFKGIRFEHPIQPPEDHAYNKRCYTTKVAECHLKSSLNDEAKHV